MADSSVSLSVFFLHRRVGRLGRGKMRVQTCGWVMAGGGGLRKPGEEGSSGLIEVAGAMEGEGGSMLAGRGRRGEGAECRE